MFTRLGFSSILAGAVVLAASSAGFAGETTVDLKGAVVVNLPSAGAEPVAFKTADGKEGWVCKISNEALPTPAYAKGRIFTGGGYGSRTFLAMDSASGKTIWSMPTQDNGPTSPVATDDNVAYNTESCHTEVREYSTGKMKWSEVTGGTLLTQPLIFQNALVIPHPTMSRERGADTRFRMLAVDLKSYKHAWDIDMPGDVLSAPVATEKAVYFTCTDGHLMATSVFNGENFWTTNAKATSAPVVVGELLAVTTEVTVSGQTKVGIKLYDAFSGEPKETPLLASTAVSGALDKKESASWDYQGPKIAATKTQLFNAPGNTVNAVNIKEAKAAWQVSVKADGLGNNANSLTPPALGKENVYVGSASGHVFALKQSDGSLTMAYKFSDPLVSQPILADGNIYFGTTTGKIVCLKLASKDATDWHAWGGNVGHNKVD